MNIWLDRLLSGISFTAVAGILGKLYLHLRGRVFEKKLSIDVSASVHRAGHRRSVFFEVKLTNAGRVKVQAFAGGPGVYAYQDSSEALRYSCSLQLRRVDSEKLGEAAIIDWYDEVTVKRVDGIEPELNLLDEYLLPLHGNVTAFWLEPGDTAYLTAVVVLPAGFYLAKIAFYGTKLDEDYWHRLVELHLD